MILLYVHDLHFQISNRNEPVCAGGLTEEYFDKFKLAGFESIIICSRTLQKRDENIKEYSAKFSPKIFSLLDPQYKNYAGLLDPARILRLVKAIKKADMIVLNTPSITGIFIGILCLVLQKDYVCEVAGSADAFKAKPFGRLVTPIIRLLTKFLVAKALGATYVTNSLQQIFPNKLCLVSSNVIIRDYGDAKQLKLKDKYFIGCVGGLVTRKGLGTIIQCARLMKKNHRPDVHFLIVGHGPQSYWNEATKRFGVDDKVTLLGGKVKSDVIKFLDDIDLYIQPSFSEGLPRATIEAMSRGNPCFGTDLAGFREILSSEYLIEVGAAEELACKISTVLSRAEIYNHASADALAVSKKFEYTVLVNNKVDFYKSLIRRSE